MLEIINTLSPFFEDNYKEISVREYARKMKISPPTASKILNNFKEQGLLKKREDRNFLFFRVVRENKIAEGLSRIYWLTKFQDLLGFLEKELSPDSVVLFGSLSKLEAKKDSDIDLAIFYKGEKELNLSKFEKDYKRKIQIFQFDSIEKVNKQLRLAILNGYLMRGYLS